MNDDDKERRTQQQSGGIIQLANVFVPGGHASKILRLFIIFGDHDSGECFPLLLSSKDTNNFANDSELWSIVGR